MNKTIVDNQMKINTAEKFKSLLTSWASNPNYDNSKNQLAQLLALVAPIYDNITPSFITTTKANLDLLILSNGLKENVLYEITGVHPTLYDDGTTSGTTIYLKAISTNELEKQGTGKFYNPKYNQAVDGFGIWENKMYGTFTNIVGNFDYLDKETVTANNGATGLLLADGMIQWVSGDWSLATSITGLTSTATADVSGFVTPTYSIGNKVIWGGYSWTNVDGLVGASTDILTLDASWTKDVYDTTNYNISCDVIEYDYANDWISRRYDPIADIDVKFTKDIGDYFIAKLGINFNAIAVQQWGNALNTSTSKGVGFKIIDNGYDEAVNFAGDYQNLFMFDKLTYKSNQIIGLGVSQSNFTLGLSAQQNTSTLGQGSSQYDFTLEQNSSQYDFTLGQGSSQNNFTLGQSANQNNFTLGQDANQNNFTLGLGARQDNFTLGQNSSQYDFTLGQSSSQYYFTLGQDANQNNFTLGLGAFQNNFTLGQGVAQTNIVINSKTNIDFINTVFTSVIENITFNCNVPIITPPNLSTATLIYDATLIKNVYTRPDGTIRLTYMNDFDVQVIADITD